MNNKNLYSSIVKRLFLFGLISVFLCFCLVACGQSNNSSSDSPQGDYQESTETDTVITDETAEESNLTADVSQYGEAVDDENTIFEDYDGNLTILDKNNKVLASSENGDFQAIYAYGDGFYALWKNVSDFDHEGTTLWVIDSSGTELLRLDDPNYSMNYSNGVSGGGETTSLSYTTAFSGSDHFGTVNNYYCGAGWIYFYKKHSKDDLFDKARKVEADYFNCSSKEWKSLDTYDVNSGISHYPLFEDNPYTFVGSDKRSVSIINTDLNEVYKMDFNDSEDEVYFGEYSDGGFIYNNGTQFYFLDCQSWTSTLICKDSDKISGSAMSYKYINGKALIALNGADGKQYCAVVDKQGNYIKEPYLGEYSIELEKIENGEI